LKRARRAGKKIVVPPHIPLDFPGTGSIAVHVDGPLLGCHPPGSARRACGGASIAMGDADPEDEDDGQQTTPQANKERRKGRYRRGEQAGSQPQKTTRSPGDQASQSKLPSESGDLPTANVPGADADRPRPSTKRAVLIGMLER